MLSKEEIDKYAEALGSSLRHIAEVSPQLKNIDKTLQEYSHLLKQHEDDRLKRIETQLQLLVHQLEKLGIPRIDQKEISLKCLYDYFNTTWPRSIDPVVRHLNGAEKAHQIISHVLPQNIESENVLIFGGEIATLLEARAKGAKKVVGFQTEVFDNPQYDGIHFAADDQSLRVFGLNFRHAVMFDYLDHITDPLGVLKLCKKVMENEGTLHVRCHPWFSKHGEHIHECYEAADRSFAHLVFTDEQLLELGLKRKFTLRSVKGVSSYRDFFKSAGFVIDDELIYREEIPSELLNYPELWNRLTGTINSNIDLADLQITVIDFRLKIAK